MISTIDYKYDPFKRHRNPISQSYTASDGTEYRVRNLYAFDEEDFLLTDDAMATTTELCHELRERNIISSPIEVIKEYKVGDTWVPIDATHSQYSFYTNGILSTKQPTSHPYLYARHDLDVTWDEGDNYALEGWTTTDMMTEYNTDWGRPKKVFGTGQINPYELTWNSSTGNLEGVKFLDHVWDYNYYPGTNLIWETITHDAQVTIYDYDGLLRVSEIQKRDNNVNITYSYEYGLHTGELYNSVKSRTKYTTAPSSGLSEVRQNVYYDGLGRKVQDVRQGHSQHGKDVVTAYEYDQFNRLVTRYMPFASSSSDGSPVEDLSGKPSEYTDYYPDPLSRPRNIFRSALGSSYVEYSSNDDYVVTPDGTLYPPKSLHTTRIERGTSNLIIDYTDYQGKTIVSERFEDIADPSTVVRTRHLFDPKGRLSTIYPSNVSDDNSQNLTYNYRYDGADNVIYSKVPDRGAIHTVYDERNLPILVQSPSLPVGADYHATIYDDYGRFIKEGFVSDVKSMEMVDHIDPEKLLSSVVYGTENIKTDKIVSGTTALLSSDGLSDKLSFKHYYDSYGRIDTTTGNHHLNLDNKEGHLTTFRYDFADNVVAKMDQHTLADNSVLGVFTETSIDHAGRPQTHVFQVEENENKSRRFTTSQLEYTPFDDIDKQYLGKTVNGWLQEVNYKYLKNGLLNEINNPTDLGSDLFAIHLDYSRPSHPSGARQSNGNISAMTIRTASGQHFVQKFKYDDLNRLLSSSLY